MPLDPTGLAVRWDGDEPVIAPMLRVIIDVDRCKGCGLCVAVCPPAVLALGSLNAMGYSAAVLGDNEKCTSCTACGLICPEVAIVVLRPSRGRARSRARP